jgi:gliding motility-associated-like protein
LRDQPDVKVIIFDREGMKVYEMPGNGGWDGTNIGIPLPSADYWFMIQYPAALSKKPQIGHFTLLR